MHQFICIIPVGYKKVRRNCDPSDEKEAREEQGGRRKSKSCAVGCRCCREKKEGYDVVTLYDITPEYVHDINV